MSVILITLSFFERNVFKGFDNLDDVIREARKELSVIRISDQVEIF